MESSPNPSAELVLGEGHYTVVLAGGGHRTLEATRAEPDFQLGLLGDLPTLFRSGRS